MISGIYIIENTADGKVYVGSTNNFKVRWQRHMHDLNKGIHTGGKLQRAWAKHGRNSFEFHVIEYVKDLSTLLSREQYWLDKLQSVRRGYNILPTAGNNSGHKLSASHKAVLSFKGRKHSEESKQRMSIAAQIRIVSAETKRKQSIARLGKKMSDETKEKMRIIGTGRTHSEETRKKLSASHTGKTLPIEVRLKMSNSTKGKLVSEETRRKLSIAATKAHARKKSKTSLVLIEEAQ